LLGSLLGLLVPLTVLGAGVAALRNVFSDTFVERLAMDKACVEQSFPCRAQMTRWERTAIGQTFDMYTPRGTVTVRCQREYYLVGDYQCTRLDLPALVAAEPPSPAPKPSAPAAGKPDRSARPP
jgi:hypothetical protein